METFRPWHDSAMLGVPVRVHDMSGDDLGVAHGNGNRHGDGTPGKP